MIVYVSYVATDLLVALYPLIIFTYICPRFVVAMLRMFSSTFARMRYADRQAYDVALAHNLIQKSVGANRWIPLLVTMCGFCGMMVAFTRNYAGLLVVRFVLGFFEGGILPGIVGCHSVFSRATEDTWNP